MSRTSDLVRAQFKSGDDLRDRGLATPEDVCRYDNIHYGPDPVWQVLDVYRPRAAAGQVLPVIVSVHGGAWVYGDKERYQYYCMSLAQRGFAVVNFTYRLAPEFQFPASLEDTNLVFTWVLDHAGEYGMDRDGIFAVGDSAGGHILGLYTAICTDSDYAQKYPFSLPEGFVPRGIALNCGVYHCERKENDLTTELMADLLPGGGTDEELSLIDVLTHVNKKFPPIFLMTAVGDFLKDEALLMAQELLRHDCPFEFHYYGDEDRRLVHVFHCDVKSSDANICNSDECNFFRRLIQ